MKKSKEFLAPFFSPLRSPGDVKHFLFIHRYEIEMNSISFVFSLNDDVLSLNMRLLSMSKSSSVDVIIVSIDISDPTFAQ